ncbi:hypothetical protein THTE_2745 [Thermogutta terrifontis]|uniref:Uncharacterized protein n=1 Tax=Thermogutta terrifontis TaxID=1331910 RepID=A0A286RHC0_9BACT|nr:hypothetical protein THTE_2745 [Thermogutta terrifontis]
MLRRYGIKSLNRTKLGLKQGANMLGVEVTINVLIAPSWD